MTACILALLPPLTSLCSWVASAQWLRYAHRRGLFDQPNRRSSHHRPTPRGGGLAVASSFLLATLLLMATGCISLLHGMTATAGIVLCAGIGALDDHHHLPALIRLAVHFLAIGITLLALHGSGLNFAAFLLLPSLVWCINLYNFMDGIDALAVSEAVCIATGALLAAWIQGGQAGLLLWLACLTGAALGFLPWNLPQARMFMGDAGSCFFGYIFAFFATLTWEHDLLSPWIWIILGAVFIADATLTLMRRILRGERFYQAHRSHGYQILSRRLGSHGKVSAAVVAVNICWLWPLALAAARRPAAAPWIALSAYVPLLAALICIRAGTTDD